MVQEAEQYADEDKATKERIEARNGLENYAFSLKNQLNDEEGLGGKIEEDDKETVRSRSLALWHTDRIRTNSKHSFSRPSRRPPTGSRRTAPRPTRRTLRSRRRSCPMSPTPSPASCTLARAAPTAETTSLTPTTSYRCVEVVIAAVALGQLELFACNLVKRVKAGIGAYI